MKKVDRGIVIAFAVVAFLGSGATRADCDLSQGGFLAGLGECVGVIDSKQKAAIDGGHAAMGRPLDRAAEAAATYYAPGSVQAYQGLQQAQRAFQPPQMASSFPYPAPNYGYGQPSFDYQPVVSNKCGTNMGLCLINQIGQVGTACWCNSSYGMVNGSLIP